ncbi:MAG: hypothetical protein V3U73_14305, partial [bacterium]
MKYHGKYTIFDPSQIETYPLRTRRNRVKLEDLILPKQLTEYSFDLPKKIHQKINAVAQSVVSHRKMDKPVILFTGAHLIKNGLGPLVVDLVKR